MDAIYGIIVLCHLAWKQEEVPEDWRRAISLGRAERKKKNNVPRRKVWKLKNQKIRKAFYD